MLRAEAFIMRHMLCMPSDKHTIFLHLQPGQARWQVQLRLAEDTRHRLAESAQLSDRYTVSRRPANIYTHTNTHTGRVQQNKAMIHTQDKHKGV